MYPLARTGLIVEELAAETVIYDQASHHAHCLNPTVSFVWKQCDGQTTDEEIASRLAEHVGLPPDTNVVQLALRQLSGADLLTRESVAGITSAFPSRRELAKRVALLGSSAAVLMPVLSSIVAPTPSMAQSGNPNPGGGNPGGGNPGGGNRGGGK